MTYGQSTNRERLPDRSAARLAYRRFLWSSAELLALAFAVERVGYLRRINCREGAIHLLENVGGWRREYLNASPKGGTK